MRFENTEVWGFKHALRGMRNALESWDKSDSTFCDNLDCRCEDSSACTNFSIGKDDLKLAQSLIKAGDSHSKFMRMIHVSVDINMPRYWWSEADTYHFNTKNSCSTMHKLLNNNNPITLDNFLYCNEDKAIMETIVFKLEDLRMDYKLIQSTTKNTKEMERLLLRAKRLLPEGFLQMRTFDTNYAELRNMYFQRRHHKLKEEWIDTFCKWVETLPYAKELICCEK